MKDTSLYVIKGNTDVEAGLDLVIVGEVSFNSAALPVRTTPGN